MDAVGGDGWSEAFPWLVRTGRGWKLRELLAVAEHAHRNSAMLMRALGRDDLARQAEWFAARARFDLDEPEAAQLLYGLTRDLRERPWPGPLLDKALDGALSLSGAERGNVQVIHPETGSLTIAAQHGFSTEFLDHFAVVDDDGSACGRAATRGVQVVVADVSTDPGFRPHRDIAAASGYRAVQSTPLVDLAGRLVGVVSTHYPGPYCPSERDLRVLRRYGELVGAAMTSRSCAAPRPADAQQRSGTA